VQVTVFWSSRSNHSFEIIPWVAGKAPVEIVAWPAHVFRGGVGIGGIAEPRAFFNKPLEAARPLATEF